jgi:membrane-associated phospholipid phosphatase
MPPLLSAIANAGRHGVLVKSAVVMERLGHVSLVALDKTGTLMSGTPVFVAVRPLPGGNPDDLLDLAAGAEAPSEHPIGRSIVAAAVERGLTMLPATGFRAEEGRGVRATVDGRTVTVTAPSAADAGTPQLATAIEHEQAEGHTPVVVSVEGRRFGVIAVSTARPTARMHEEMAMPRSPVPGSRARTEKVTRPRPSCPARERLRRAARASRSPARWRPAPGGARRRVTAEHYGRAGGQRGQQPGDGSGLGGDVCVDQDPVVRADPESAGQLGGRLAQAAQGQFERAVGLVGGTGSEWQGPMRRSGSPRCLPRIPVRRGYSPILMTAAPRTALSRIDHAGLRSTRRALGRTPAVPVAQGLSHFGEHALGWLALGAVGWLDGRRRDDWAAGMAGVVAAHAVGVVVKRVTRRVRPALDDVPALVKTPSRLSFPSAHSCSTAAAAVGYAPMLGTPVMAAVTAVMLVSRVLLGVHYPSDVVSGAALGAGVATAVRRRMSRRMTRTAGRKA